MSWEKVMLGSVAETCLGKMLDRNKNRGSYHPYLANINVRWGAFDLENLQEMRFEADENERYGLKYGDLVICEGGEPGRCALWRNQIPNMKIQKALHRVRVNDEMDSRYVYYWFLLAGRRGALQQYYTGATIMHMTGQKLRTVIIDKPPLDIQNKISDYLKSFDNLIENNQKQIKLLEEAAQRLYKKWFIDLRFPGHKDVEIVDGIPAGWNIGILGDIGTFKRGKTITKTKIVEGEVPVISGGLGPAYYHNESNTSSPVITVSGSGANAGFTRLYYTKVFASDCSFVDIEQTSYLYWIYLFLKNNSSRIDMLQKGSAQPHVYAKDINALECIIPMKETLNLFCEVVSSYFDKIGILDKQIIRLTEARDRLLPKLMNGEIEV